MTRCQRASQTGVSTGSCYTSEGPKTVRKKETQRKRIAPEVWMPKWNFLFSFENVYNEFICQF